jgi:hypothetical protein
VNEAGAAEKWLYEKLSGLASGRVFASIAPEGTALPYLIYHQQAARDVTRVGGGLRLVSRPLYLVKAVCEGRSYAAADAIASAADELLCGASGSVDLGTAQAPDIYHVVCEGREGPVRYPELVGGAQWRHSGGLYRLQVQRAP